MVGGGDGGEALGNVLVAMRELLDLGLELARPQFLVVLLDLGRTRPRRQDTVLGLGVGELVGFHRVDRRPLATDAGTQYLTQAEEDHNGNADDNEGRDVEELVHCTHLAW